ncbi:hypothetical protein [Cohnella nanjingensis]|uniref:hypothetical protein n=1 Tax=Cohnella nanjingensis TaxID=1387779 RepID=UPI001623944B|nr:hypothetical protein [Cohnella nanjingensis]
MSNNFYAYRYFIVPTEQQMTMNQLFISDKRELLVNFFELLKTQKKAEGSYWSKNYILYLTKELANGLFLCKFAKQKNITIYEPGSSDIEDTPENTYPFIYIVVDLNSQILFFQEKQSIFPNRATSKNSFCQLINSFIEDYDYLVTIDEITYEQNFWKELDSHESIYELELTMKSPNLFGSLVEAEELLKEINKTYNNTETTLKVKNDKGKLRVVRDKIQSFIKYISAGGGKWVLGVTGKGSKRVVKIKSTHSVRTVQLHVIDDNLDLQLVINEITVIDEIIKNVNDGTTRGKNHDENQN